MARGMRVGGSLTAKVVSGSLWLGSAKIVVRGIDILTFLVLSRFLTPADFGLVAIAASVIFLVEAVTQLSMSSALLNLKRIERSHLETAFTLGLCRGLVITLMIAAVAGPFSAYYGDQRLEDILLVLCITPVLRGMRSPNLVRRMQQMSFREMFLVDAAGKVTGFCVAVGFAVAAGGYWALVLAMVVGPSISTMASYLIAPFRPRLGLSEISHFWHLLGWLSLSQLVSAVAWQFDRLFLGQVAPTKVVGHYTMANTIAATPEQFVLRPMVLEPLLASLTQIRDEPERLARAYRQADAAIAAVGLPMLVGIATFAHPVVVVLFDESWLPTAPILSALAVALLPTLFRIPFRPLAIALGRPRIVFEAVLLDAVVRLPAMALGFYLFGVEGLIAGMGIGLLCGALVVTIFTRRLIAVRFGEQVAPFARALLAAAAMPAVALPVLGSFSGGPEWLYAVAAALAGGLSLLAYVVALMAVWLLAGRPEGGEALGMAALRSSLKKRLPREA